MGAVVCAVLEGRCTGQSSSWSRRMGAEAEREQRLVGNGKQWSREPWLAEVTSKMNV